MKSLRTQLDKANLEVERRRRERDTAMRASTLQRQRSSALQQHERSADVSQPGPFNVTSGSHYRDVTSSRVLDDSERDDIDQKVARLQRKASGDCLQPQS